MQNFLTHLSIDHRRWPWVDNLNGSKNVHFQNTLIFRAKRKYFDMIWYQNAKFFEVFDHELKWVKSEVISNASNVHFQSRLVFLIERKWIDLMPRRNVTYSITDAVKYRNRFLPLTEWIFQNIPRTILSKKMTISTIKLSIQSNWSPLIHEIDSTSDLRL